MIQQGMKHTSDQRRCGIATSELRSHKKIHTLGAGFSIQKFLPQLNKSHQTVQKQKQLIFLKPLGLSPQASFYLGRATSIPRFLFHHKRHRDLHITIGRRGSGFGMKLTHPLKSAKRKR